MRSALLLAAVAAWPTGGLAAEHVASDPLLWTHVDERAVGSLVAVRYTRLYLNQGRRPVDSEGRLIIGRGAVVHAARMVIGPRTVEARIGPAGAPAPTAGTWLSLVEEPAQIVIALADLPPGILVRLEIDTVERRATGDCETRAAPELLVDAAGYFLFTRSRFDSPPGSRGRSRLVFLLDRSGSMATGALDDAKRILRVLLPRLRADDDFNIVAFDDRLTKLFSWPQPANEENVGRAIEFLDGIGPAGGTQLGPAIEQAARSFTLGDRGVLVLLTDGVPGDAATALRLVRELPIPVVAIQDLGPHTVFFDRLKDAGAQVMDRFSAERAFRDAFPAKDLLAGYEVSDDDRRCRVVALGRHAGPPEELARALATDALPQSTRPSPIAPLWARARMRRLNAAAQQKLALAHHLLTARTRFFAVGD